MLTVTEALAETKTIESRIEKRREAILRYLVRDARMRDPLESDGGSVEFVRKERQAISDLEFRLVQIRTAIQAVNLRSTLTVQEETRTVSEWLNWRREVSEKQKAFLGRMASAITQMRQKAVAVGGTLAASVESAKPGDVISVVNEVELSGEIEHIELVLGELDGKLSLFNATITIDI